ncbi:uncharacterized protein LOC108622172 [Ceratina calcarata]|uniref:Uncharacterized protein LOC108622172 n=1 Tax=Ceratina calcarata TaxID=156304 RepID=A0AAJ7RWN1_9HYME|nr:uncharacterized protein LOC108622172 [Ceratina calcarata]XP_026667081.1 uncharacterized protein LOC108622172 [Ceratina calcarata]XP_026667082.1 uncharacterized protein LOC108622172 [Ceratina calcarata]XP_026667083.1 uncharacterized protein LOC108622172 [Ceratina calcarata]XP_026667084.1 uncharacterized protein LOC108622172 [Ceratina calcarata]XP_026667085.1 uncharacterized protein LOC108622172 [Ceratina calcarata]XP_026667086.1 uncharacterized protein LOC108622172 [Ceratina calcarata]XP_0
MDNSLPNLTTSETAEEDPPDLHKLTKTCIMLKKRISESHELIKQYNDKVKECERLKHDLAAAKSQVHKITCTHNSTLSKIIKLELKNTEYKKDIETLTTQNQDHTVKAAADEQHIQQLICKIKDIEGKQNDKMLQYDLEKSSLQVKVKELEQELKSARKLHDTKIKKIEKRHTVENENKPKYKDAEVNTEPIEDAVIEKPELVDKCILTDECYNVKNNVYPIYCNKCEILMEPPPVEKICRVISRACPKLIERIPSPPIRPLQVSTGSNTDEYRAENVPYYTGSTPMANTNNSNLNNHSQSIATIASSLAIIPWFQTKVDTLEAKVSLLEKKLSKMKSQQNNTYNYHSNSRHGHDSNNLLELWKAMTDFYKNGGIENFDMDDKRSKSRTKRKDTHSDSWNVESVMKRTDLSSNSIERFKKTKQRNKSDSSPIVIEDLEELDSNSDACTDPFNYDTLESEDMQRVKPSSSSNVEPTNRLECGKSVGGETDSGILSDSMQPESDMDLTELRNLETTMSSMRRSYCTKNMESTLVKKPVIKVASNLTESDKSIEENTMEMSIKENERIAHTEHDNRVEEIENDDLICTRITRKRKFESGEVKKSDNRKKLLQKLRSLKKTSKVETCPKTLQHRNVSESSRTEKKESSRTEKKESLVKELFAESSNEDEYVPKKKLRIAHVPKTEQKSSHMSKRLVQIVKNDIQNRSDNNDFNKLDDTENRDSSILDDVENRDSSILDNTENRDLSIFDETENRDSTILDDTENRDLSILDDTENRADQDTVNSNTENIVKDTVPMISETANSFNDAENKRDNTTDLDGMELIETTTANNSLDISKVQEPEQRSNDKHSSHTSEIPAVRKTSINSETINDIAVDKEDSNTNCETKIIQTPLMRLQQHVTKNYNSNKTKNKQKVLERVHVVDEFVKKQLQRLASSDWQTFVHWDVIEKLKSTISARIIAKGVVEFLSMEMEHPEPLDKSHTPPAPLMTRTQQKIVTLLFDLGEQKSEVFQLIQAAIEYKLFRLSQALHKSVIESLSRVYTVIARIKKDRERVRMFCCDALYCLGLNAVPVLYVVLTSWPEVFPNNETNSRPLLKCMAHIIMSIQATNFPKLNSLKNLLSVYYKYPMGSVSTEILSELLTLLPKKCDIEIETAIILLAKREGTPWTYQNIIKNGLLPMIITQKLPSSYRAFCLLGSLMRTFPIEDNDNLVGEIVAQLCDLINSGEGSDEQKEGVFSALLSLSRHKFDTVIANTVKWVPSAPLQDRTIEQINGMLNLRTVEYWKGYLRKNKLLPSIQKRSRT